MGQKRCSDVESCWKLIMSDVKSNRDLLKEIEEFARTNTEPCTVVFGTSGWRGIVGLDYTFNNVKVVTKAVVEMLRCGESSVMEAMGIKDFDDAKKRGVIVGHDNRFLGPEFAKTVMSILQDEGIKVFYSGETTTPEFSAMVVELNAACSINLTPSHNPANWAGFKFNPSDGGPAGAEITDVIERFANKMMEERIVIEDKPLKEYETLDPVSIYEEFLKKRGTIDMDKIKRFIDTEDVFICVDHVHGSTRGRPQRLIGESGKITYLRTEDDYLFGGIAPEPSSENMRLVTETLKNSSAKYKLGVIMDPDGDRVRFTDGTTEVAMNYFGAMALHFLHKYKGISGLLVKSVATSNFANAIAEKLGIKVIETKVGFKNFRPYMLPDAKERAIVAFEESDGISAYNHTLEKDAVFGLLLAIEMMADTGKNLGDYLRELQQTYGFFYPDRAGVEVDRSLVGKPLKEKLAKIKESMTVGSKVLFGTKEKTIKDVITVDGTKIVFDDDSWLLIRPSGTEPKVRFYIETRSEEEKDIMFKKAEEITKQALA